MTLGRLTEPHVIIAPMVAVTLADLAYRYRRFLIAVLGARVVMARALRAHYSLPVIAVVVGLPSSLVALRQAIGADPAAAFGG